MFAIGNKGQDAGHHLKDLVDFVFLKEGLDASNQVLEFDEDCVNALHEHLQRVQIVLNLVQSH